MKMLALDTEATGLDLWHGAEPFLVTTYTEEKGNVWWEWEVDPTTRKVLVNENDLLDILDAIKEADILILQNSKFDYIALYNLFAKYGHLAKFLAWWNWAKVRDTLTQGHVLASNQPHDLTSMVLHYLGVNIEPLEEELLRIVKEARAEVKKIGLDWRLANSNLPEMPSAKEKVAKYDMWVARQLALLLGYPESHEYHSACSNYANGDSASTLYLHQKQEELLKERGLWEIALEKQKVIPILCDMEIRGITINNKSLNEMERTYRKGSGTLAKEMYDIADSYGAELVLPKSGANNSLKSFMFDTLKLPILKRGKETGNPSVDKKVMEEYLAWTDEGTNERNFIEKLLQKRKLDTSISYMEGYRKYIRTTDNPDFGRLHPIVNPNGSDTLRMSSQNPNEQNISKIDMFENDPERKGKFVMRRMFGPMPGRLWVSIDYENLELKIPAYESGEKLMIEIFEKPNDPPYFGSYHLLNASIVYPDLFWPLAEKKGAFKDTYKATYYQWIKNFGFAIQYGAQEETADRTAHKDGATQLVKSKMPALERLNQNCINYANKFGYVETIPDKEICPTQGYPLLCRRSSWGSISPTLPLNYHVQGTACWIMLRAMIKVSEYLRVNKLYDFHIIMNVHDELVFDFPKKPGIKIVVENIQKIMESVGECVGIPLTCGVSYHYNNWGES